MHIHNWATVYTLIPAGVTAIAVWGATLYGGNRLILTTAIGTPIAVAALTHLFFGHSLGAALEVFRSLDRGCDRETLVGVIERAAELAQETSQFDSRLNEQIATARRRVLEQHQDLLTTTVHELRTPLTTIMAAIDMLRDGYVTSEEDRSAFMNQASSACHHLMFVINDLLDKAALDAGKIRIQTDTCYCNDIIGDAQRIMEPMAIVRDIELICEIREHDSSVRADHNRVMQVIFNLLGNALKFSPPGSRVGIRAQTEEDSYLVFEIWDQGSGVDQDTEKRLFERFGSGVHSSGNLGKVNSSGIGLNVSQQLVQKMGGSIGYRRNHAGTGSIFWFSLPLAAPSESVPLSSGTD